MGVAYALPVLLASTAFVFVPFVHTLLLSFQRWNGVTTAKWVGLGNYSSLLSDREVVAAFAHAAFLVPFYSIIPIAIGLFLTAILSRRQVRGMTLFRAALFLPQVITLVVVGVSWAWLLAPDGPVNGALSAAGLSGLTRVWLGDFDTALWAIGLVATWSMLGLALVLFLAGIQKISPDLYDAARIDGAGPVQEFFAITLPGLRNEIIVALVLTATTALRAFDLIYVLTRGGPGIQTTVPAWEIYQAAFVRGQLGTASATAVVLAMVVLTAAIGLVRLGRERS